MKIQVFRARGECGAAAAEKATEILRNALAAKGHASFIAATGASQFEFLQSLTNQTAIDWERTTMYHLDEYLGLPEDHPASFRRYLRERLIDRVHPGKVHLIRGDVEDPSVECDRLGGIISMEKIDVAFVGIGENGHLAFNDPPADFGIEDPFIVVELDEACRKQQLGEGWFPSLEDVPRRAISMSIRQIMKSQAIVCTVPDKRKAEAVKQCLEGKISPWNPASILKTHSNTFIYLDRDSASLLQRTGFPN
ncbi:MAG: glucosamine-6-phosphate deaminase [candidate division Zixibacteria bacterium]|nr:glucosamine-6-phosphate deaminase [candidate division Zixibacteria bacterium]